MSELLKAIWAKLVAPRDDDPLGSITVDQMALVLKSIEAKYTELQDENARLRDQVEAQRLEIQRLNQATGPRAEEKNRV